LWFTGVAAILQPMPTVTFCESSTIKEAWVLLLGPPATVDNDAFAALAHRARRLIEDLSLVPTLVVGPAVPERQPVPPFWTHQMQWAAGRYHARFGPSYLSVHFVKVSEAERYQRFEVSLRPAFEKWLAAWNETLGATDVSKVVFGYLNEFVLPAEAFDLSRYFHISVGLEMPSAGGGLSELSTRFKYRLSSTSHADVRLHVRGGGDTIRARTLVLAEQKAGLTSLSPDLFPAALLPAREAAKTVFFELTTPQTHQLMKARYA
jgi:hypothetical protein